MTLKNSLALAGWILLSQAAGAIGSIFTMSAIPEWYDALLKPELAPPNWVFAPVWTALFLLMGVAAFMVWRGGWRRAEATIALNLFILQLALNALWSVVFFGLRNPGLALVEIAILWLAIAATIWAFAKVSKPAAWLLAPYLLWVSFAAYLNYGFWVLNA